MAVSPAAGDAGLQIERTALAWQRTTLSLLGVSVVVTRLAVDALGPLVLLAVAPSLVHVVWLFRSSTRRYRSRVGVTPRSAMSVGLHGALLGGQVLLLAVVEVVSLAVRPPT